MGNKYYLFERKEGKGGTKMSQHVRAWLIELHMLNQTTHEERVEIDKEIERRTGMNCDDPLLLRLQKR